jgi:hypothetical protein
MLTSSHGSNRTHAYRFLIVILCSSFGFTAGLSVSSHGQPVPRPAQYKPVEVVGTLTLMAGAEAATATVPANRRIELPDIDVYLRNAVSGKSGDKVKTQLDGKFYLMAPSPGTYTVCWDAPGIGSGCGKRFTVAADAVSLKVVPVSAPKGVIYGKVLTGDGRPCWVSDPFFALDVSTSVTLLNASQSLVQPAVRANTEGEYAFAGLKAGRYRVRAYCEKSKGESTASLGNVAVVSNITLPNHAPRIAGIAAFDSGKGITRAAAAATIKVDAIVRDAENDAVEYLWRALEGSGSIPATNTAQQDWSVAGASGLQTLYLMARDGNGGYAFKRFDMPVGGAGVGFSGRAIDETTMKPVAHADVTVNGASTTTNDQGWFSLTTASVPSPERYVLNINHPNYALLSRVWDKSATGDTYALIRVQSTSHDPAGVIDVTDNKSSGPCGAREGQTPTLSGHGRGAKPKNPDVRRCKPVGARLILPAGVLVDADQKPAQGPVSLQFATMNPARRSLPGDYRAVNRTNDSVEMLSYGALYAQFRDNAGRPLNLKAGNTAEIRVPVPAEQQASAKPTISLWSYDEARGIWVEEGQATLKSTPQGPMYVGRTIHFSTLNMDVAGNDPAQATCVRFELGASLSGWTNLVMRAYVSYGGTAVQVKETPIVGGPYHAIYRIPYAPPAPPPNTLRLEIRGTYNGTEVVLLNNVINTDAPRPKMTGTNLWPDYPYTECGAVITLEADPVNLPYYGDIDATGRPAFLTGPFGQFLPPNGEQVATDYYQTIDPGNATNPNLRTWWTNHGFNTDGTGGTNAAYLNHNDLGFGRDMNCKTTGSDLACYVTNYGAPDQNPNNADDAVNRTAAKRGATVAMEYKSSESATQRVRFYVYGGGDPATAGKLKFADLDGLGPKSVPHLCLVCHGGTYDDVAHNTTQARFREFDLQSFKYSGGRSWDYPPTADSNNLTADELTAFATLNQMVRDVQPSTSAIKELINNWYPGGFAPGTKPSQSTVPSGWNTQAAAYRNVFAKSCRTCHVARDGGVTNAFFTFSSSSNYAGTSYVVCNSPKVMPNAYITYKNFWNDPQRVIDYKVLTGAATCQ